MMKLWNMSLLFYNQNTNNMRKIFITYIDYPPGHNATIIYNAHTKPRFLEYCKIHGFEFVEITTNLAHPYNLGFAKLFYIRDIINTLNDGDVITYMDVDCCIMDSRKAPIFEKDFAIVQESTGCLCMGGTWSLRVSDWSKRFIKEICSDEIQAKNKHLPTWKVWHENDAVYHVIGLEWATPLSEMGKRNTTIFTIDEINEHVQILPTEWGMTFCAEDTALDYSYYYSYNVISQYERTDINCTFDTCIVRHLSAGTMYENWANRYFNTPMK